MNGWDFAFMEDDERSQEWLAGWDCDVREVESDEAYDCPIHGLQDGPDCPKC